jgi:hypothetical protein
MLEGLRRELSNLRRKKKEDVWLYMQEIGELIDGFSNVSLKDTHYQIFDDAYREQERILSDELRKQNLGNPLNTSGFIQDKLNLLSVIAAGDSMLEGVFNLHHEVYVCKGDEKHYMDAYKRPKDGQGWSKVMAIECTALLE